MTPSVLNTETCCIMWRRPAESSWELKCFFHLNLLGCQIQTQMWPTLLADGVKSFLSHGALAIVLTTHWITRMKFADFAIVAFHQYQLEHNISQLHSITIFIFDLKMHEFWCLYVPYFTISSMHVNTYTSYTMSRWYTCRLCSKQESDQGAGREALPAFVHGRVACQHCAWQDLLGQACQSSGSENRCINLDMSVLIDLRWSRVGSSDFQGATAASTWHEQLFVCSLHLERIVRYITWWWWMTMAWQDIPPDLNRIEWPCAFWCYGWSRLTSSCWAK